MPPTQPTPASRLLARSRRLPSALLARRSAPRARLAARVAEAHRLRVGRIARRLWRAPAAAAPAFAPEGMSDFASRWIFGDGRAEGTPLDDSEARAALARAAGPPSFQDHDHDDEADGPLWPDAVPSSAALARTPVEEFGARRAQAFRLSSTPPTPSPLSPPEAQPAAPARAPAVPAETTIAATADAPAAGDAGHRPADAPAERIAAQAAPPSPAVPTPTRRTPAASAQEPASGTETAPTAPPVRPVLARTPVAVAPGRPLPPAAPLRLAARARLAAPAPIAASDAPAGQPSAGARPPSPRPGLLRRVLNVAVGNRGRGRAPAPPDTPDRIDPPVNRPGAAVGRATADARPAPAVAVQDVAPPTAPAVAEPDATAPAQPAQEELPTASDGAGEPVATAASHSPPKAGDDAPLPTGRPAGEPEATAAGDAPRAELHRAAASPRGLNRSAAPGSRGEPGRADAPAPSAGGPPGRVAPTVERRASPAAEHVASPAARPSARAEPATGDAPKAAPPVAPSPSPSAPDEGAEPAVAGGTPARGTLVARTPAAWQPSATARPLLRAERRPRPTAVPAASADQPTSGAHLAQALGLPLTPEPDGSVSIALDDGRAGASVSTAAPVLAREPMGDAEMAPSPAPAPASPAAAPAAPAGAPAPTIDEIYEQVVERLRRDLLVERERMGDLIGGLP